MTPPSSTALHHASQDAGDFDNDFTTSLIPEQLIDSAANFWLNCIDTKPNNDKIEIGCSIYMQMISSDKELKNLFKATWQKKSIESQAVRFLDMMSLLIRLVRRNDVNLITSLQSLGASHRHYGVKREYFTIMLQSIHDTLSYYFPDDYKLNVRYAIDCIFTLAACIMLDDCDINVDCDATNFDLDKKGSAGLDAKEQCDFLKSLDSCLESTVGREYLYCFLRQCYCGEVAAFLQLWKTFRSQTSDKQRFMIARIIYKDHIVMNAPSALNLSHYARTRVVRAIEQLENAFICKQRIEVSPNFFDDVVYEVKKSVLDNHWSTFKATFKNK
jgi:hemoglobin-like flavoprotein